MPDREVKTIQDLIYYQYAELRGALRGKFDNLTVKPVFDFIYAEASSRAVERINYAG